MMIVGALLAFVVTILFMFALRPVASAVGLVDIPGGRKRHDSPVPVIGGLAMVIGLLIGSSLLVDHPDFWYPTLLAVALLAVVGTIDDRFELPPSVRLIAQSCAALLVVFGAEVQVANLGSPLFFDLPLGAFGPLFTMLFVVTVTNGFNVIDGIDGLAGGLAFLGLISLAIIGSASEVFSLAVITSVSVLAFLLFNFPIKANRPVRTFMGDAGSTVLGFMVACMGIAVSQDHAVAMSPTTGLWFIAVPVFDLFSAVMRRIVQGKSPFAPDHEHLHHVLMVNGLSPKSTLAFMLSLAVLFVTAGIVGHMAGIADGVMLVCWVVAGCFFYQTMRRPQLVVRMVTRVQKEAREAIRTLLARIIHERT